MPRKKTEPVVVQEESKVQEVTVPEKKELEIKPEVVPNKNAVSFVKPQVQSQQQETNQWSFKNLRFKAGLCTTSNN
jgi:hypothetical protein